MAKNRALLQQTLARGEKNKVLEAEVARLNAVVATLLEQAKAFKQRNQRLLA